METGSCLFIRAYEQIKWWGKNKSFSFRINNFPPSVILMDEPTNHLDLPARKKVYEFISTTRATVLIVSP